MPKTVEARKRRAISLRPLSLRPASTASSHPSFAAMPKRLGFIAALLVLVSVSSQGAHAQATGGGGGMMGGGVEDPTAPVGMGPGAGAASTPMGTGGGGAAPVGRSGSSYVEVTQELYVSYFNRPADTAASERRG